MDKKTLYVNGDRYEVLGFAFDGCHKIYLIEDEKDLQDMKNRGYEPSDFHEIEDIVKVWTDSCPFRFIDTWKLKTVVPQCFDGDLMFHVIGAFTATCYYEEES